MFKLEVRLVASAILSVLAVLPLQGQGSHENWSGWLTLDGQTVSSAPAVARNSNGHLEVFMRNAAGQMYHSAQASPGSDTWSAWADLGWGLAGNPVAVTDSRGRVWLFVRGTNGALYRKWQWTPGGDWSAWYTFDGALQGDPAVVLFDNRLHVFVRGTNNILYFRSQTNALDEFTWSGWMSLGGALRSNPAAIVDHDGRLEVYVRGTDDALHYRSYLTAWSGWIGLGGAVVSDPAVASNSTGVEVIVRGNDQRLWHIGKTHGQGWGPWTSLGGQVVTSDPVLAVNHDGRLEVFVRGSDGAVHHNYQGIASGTFTGWSSLGGIPAANTDIAVGQNNDGRLQIFVRASDSALDHKAQVVPGG